MSATAPVIASRRSVARERERHPAGLDLGEIEHVVDEPEQVTPVAEHGFEKLPLHLGDLPDTAAQDQVGEADDRVERRSQLVRHVGEKFSLEPGRAQQLGVLLDQLALAPADLLERAGAIQRHDRLIAEGAQELEVVRVEGTARCRGG